MLLIITKVLTGERRFAPQQKKLFQAVEPETVSHLSNLLSAASQLLG